MFANDVDLEKSFSSRKDKRIYLIPKTNLSIQPWWNEDEISILSNSKITLFAHIVRSKYIYFF